MEPAGRIDEAEVADFQSGDTIDLTAFGMAYADLNFTVSGGNW